MLRLQILDFQENSETRKRLKFHFKAQMLLDLQNVTLHK